MVYHLLLVLVTMVQDYIWAIHGSAPDIAGKNVANPFWNDSIFSDMCLRESLNQPDAADELEQHIYNMIEHGQATALVRQIEYY